MAELLDPQALRAATRLLVMQPTAFCNINCDYCYLPHRDDKRRLALSLAEPGDDNGSTTEAPRAPTSLGTFADLLKGGKKK